MNLTHHFLIAMPAMADPHFAHTLTYVCDHNKDGEGEMTEVTIRMNQTDLAQLAGTSRESVSRFLAELERAGVVRSGRGRVTVLQPGKLRNYIY